MRWTIDPSRTARRSRVPASAGLLLILLLGAVSLGGPAHAAAVHPGGAKAIKLGDDANKTLAVGNQSASIFDNVSNSSLGPGAVRAYWLNVTTTGPTPVQAVEVQTEPQIDWEGYGQFPLGADNLPPLADWTWWVASANGTNDTANWTVDPDGVHLDRTIPWGAAGFEFQGVVHADVMVAVDPSSRLGRTATGTGFVMNAPGYVDGIPPDPGYANLTASIAPALVRISMGLGGQITGWNSTNGQPTFNFAGLDAQFQLIESTGAAVLLSLPAGTFGDGNSLPNGTPLNYSVPVVQKLGSGYFPTPAAYYSIVSGIANHTYATGETVAYWSIGNEVVLVADNETRAYASVINAAIDALAVHYPEARVGTDDMMDPQYLPEFANLTPRVGFLSLHRYPSDGLCITPNGTYCPPIAGGQGTPTPLLFSRPAFQVGAAGHLTPQQAAGEWHNQTGRWIPVLVTEVNLGFVGGPGAPNQSLGTDPRIQSLIGAAWLGSFLIQCSADNVSAITFFAFTSGSNVTGTQTYPYGGFGFGLTNESASGVVTKFAPYWAMRLWGTYFPFGAPGVAVNDSDPQSVLAWAVASGPDVDLALVNQVVTNSTVHLQVPANYSLNRTIVLDSSTYQQTYHPLTHSTAVVRSGIRTTMAPASPDLTIHGYGMAVAVFAPLANSTNSTNSSGGGGNGSGGNHSSGSGNNSGNNTGNNSRGGNGTGNPNGSDPNGSHSGSSNRSGNQTSSQNSTGGSNSSNGTNGTGGDGSSGASGSGPSGGHGGAAGHHAARPPPLGVATPDVAGVIGDATAGWARMPARTLTGVVAAIGILGAGLGAVFAARRRDPDERSK